MQDEPDGVSVIAQLEQLKQRLDESLQGLADEPQHRPMHDVVGALIHRIAVQHAEIGELRRQLAETRRHPN